MTTSQAIAKTPEKKAALTEAQIKALAPHEKLNYQFTRFKDLVIARREELAMSMPKHVDADRMLRVALTEVRKTPKLLEADIVSLLGKVAESAALGLELGGPLGQAYLVPFGNKVELIIGYKGLIDLARRSGAIKTVEARAVFKSDKFEYAYGMNPMLIHTPADETDAKDLTHAYAIVHFKDGGFQMEVMGRKQIEKIRDVALAKNFGKGPWKDHEVEMWKKTALRRLAKMLPLQSEMASHIDNEERVERGALVSDSIGQYDDLTGEVVHEAAGELEPPKQ